MTARKSVIFIGASPRGLAAATLLARNGHRVTVLEAAGVPGQGLSWRPDFNRFGIVHSGAFFPNNRRAEMCGAVYEMLGRPTHTHDDATWRFDRNSIRTGKLLVARTDEDIATLEIMMATLGQRGVPYRRITDPKEIDDLNEPFIANSSNTKVVVLLEHVRILDIPGFTKEISASLKHHRGELILSNRVIGFQPPSERLRLAAIHCDNGLTYYADAVVNCAGQHSCTIAELAADALRKSPDAESAPPPTPPHMVGELSVLVWNGPEANRPYAHHLSYFPGLAKVEGMPGVKSNESGVGAHVYLSDPIGDGRHWITIGPFRNDSTMETAGRRTSSQPLVMTDDIIARAKIVYPGFNPADWRIEHAGSTFRVLRPDGERDFMQSVCRDDKTGFFVLNSHAGDTPGLTSIPPLARDISRQVEDFLATKDLMPDPATRKAPARQPGGKEFN